MDSDRNTKTTDWPQKERPEESLRRAFWNVKEADKCHNVNKGNVNTHWVIQVPLLVVMYYVVQTFSQHGES